MQKKHRLIFLATILAGLILFYFGVDTWMKQKQVQQNQPPPIVLKPVAPVKPQTQEPKKEEQKPQTTKQETKVKKEEIRKEGKKLEQKQTQEKKTAKELPKKEVKVAKKPAETQKKTTALRTYKFQVGAFRYRENAYKMAKIVRSRGFEAKVVKVGNLYRVYAYVKAKNYWEAKRKIKRYFKDAIFVRK